MGKIVGAYGVNIIGLSNKVHNFDYEVDGTFFRQYGTDLISKGDFRVTVELNKHETFIEADFKIKGTATLICDRSLEPFEQPLTIKRKLLFKYGEVNEEVSDEIVIIHRDTATLELGQYIYEFIALAVPIKKLHPKFETEKGSEEENEIGKIVYSSGTSEEVKEEDPIDPRWNILKKLK